MDDCLDLKWLDDWLVILSEECLVILLGVLLEDLLDP